MKNTFKTLSIALVALLAFTGCEDDKGSNYETPNYLVGTWELQQVGTQNAAGIIRYNKVTPCNGTDYTNITFAPNYTYADETYDTADTCALTTSTGNYGIINGDIVLNDSNEVERRLDVGLFTDKELDVVQSNADGSLIFYKLFKR